MKAPRFSETARSRLGWVATVTGAGATAGGAALWLAGPFLPFEPPLHTWLLFGTVALGVASLAAQALGARRVAGIAFACLGLVLASLFFGWLVGPVRASTRGIQPLDVSTAPRRPDRVRVLSYNVLHGYPRFDDQEDRFAALERALEQLAPDIVLFQEAWCTRRHGCLINRLAAAGAALHGYYLAYAPVNGSLRLIGFEEGLAIASRWPIERVEVNELRPRERPWRHRAMLEVVIRIDGAAWTLVTSHLANLEADARASQARSLADLLSGDGPLVLGADLNDPAGSPTLEPLVARGLSAVLSGDRDHVLVRGFDGVGGWQVADRRWVLTAPDLETLARRREAISDHPAAWIELERGLSEAVASPDAR